MRTWRRVAVVLVAVVGSVAGAAEPVLPRLPLLRRPPVPAQQPPPVVPLRREMVFF